MLFKFIIKKVHFGCWNSSKEIVEYMHDHGLGSETKDFLQLWAEFHVGGCGNTNIHNNF